MTPEPDTSASMTAVAYCERGYDEEMGEHSRHKMSKCPAIQQAIAADCRRYALAVLQDVDDGSAAEVNRMQTDDLTPTLTSNGIRPLEYDRDGWLIRSRQKGKRHPLDPLGVCMSCGDHKIGHWMWVSEEPDD